MRDRRTAVERPEYEGLFKAVAWLRRNWARAGLVFMMSLTLGMWFMRLIS